jgi:hypothetical protein
MIKIFGVGWHIGHQFSLIQIPDTHWTYLINNVRPRWNIDVRPMPDNLNFVTEYESGKYDLAVLHVDQQCIDPKIGKGKLYRDLNKVITDIPKIVINHGTPYWEERWESQGRGCWSLPVTYADAKIDEIHKFQKEFLINGGNTIEGGKLINIEGMKKLIGNNTMVVNSHQAVKDWGWGTCIIHGLDPNDWWDMPKEPRAVISLSPGGLDSYYGRPLLMRTKELLSEKYGLKIVHIGDPREWTIERHPRFKEIGGWGAYRDYLGKSLVYFNSTQQSPMPRSRTEAMLSGCCVLTTPYQGADTFINFDTRKIWENSTGITNYIEEIDKILNLDGINGIIIPNNPEPIIALINHLIYNRFKTAVKIGQEGKKTAIRLFKKDRYEQEWVELINKVLSKDKNV